MARTPSQKGTSFLPIVLALKAHPERKRLVPERLWKYFDERLVISGWYPEKDYFALVDALVKTMDPKKVGGDVWRYFATVSARADIGGKDTKGAARTAGPGVYRNFADVDAKDPDMFFRKALRIWSQYHDTGTLEIVGKRPNSSSIVMRLVGFVIPIEGFVRLQGYYLEEYGRLVGLPVTSTVRRSTANGDPFCEWEIVLERSPAAEAYLATLREIRE